MNGAVISETFAAEVLRILSERGLAIDPQYRGETARLMDNAAYRMKYQRANGVTVDELGELIWSVGLTSRRLDCREVLDALDDILRPCPRPRGRKVVTAAAIDAGERKARAMRLRKYVCDGCQQIARGTRSSDLICGRCYANDAVVSPMRRVDPLPEEVLSTAAAL